MMKLNLKTEINNLKERKNNYFTLKTFKKPLLGLFEFSSHFGLTPVNGLGLKKQSVSEFDQIFEVNR